MAGKGADAGRPGGEAKSSWQVEAWPPRALPHPKPLYGTYRWELQPGGAFEFSDQRRDQRAGEYDEIYLQLFRLDLDDEEQIVRFVNDFDTFDVYEPNAETELFGGAIRRPPYPKFSAYPGFDGYDEYDEATPLAQASQKARSRIQDLKRIELGLAMPRPTIEEFRWSVRCLRDLTRAYWCLAHRRAASEFNWENPLIDYDVTEGSERRFWHGREIEEFVAETLVIGLRGYSPRLALPELRSPLDPTDWDEQFAAANDLWAVCCLELFNHIAEGALYKQCANERCGRPFVRQQGRSKHGQRRRTGVRYCSHACARAQAQRNYQRRRKTAAR